MRIRNSRPPFPSPSLSDPISSSMHLPLRNGLYFDDPFLVQETNRQIGWSCYPLKNPAYSCGELRKVITMEIRSRYHEDNKRGESFCMQEKSIQALGGQDEAQANEADEGNELYVSTKEYGNASRSTVNSDIAQPFASCKLGGGVPYKKKQQTYQPETDMARDKEEHAKPEEKTEPGNISEHNIEDKNGSKRTRTLCCPINCEFFIPPENEGFVVHGMQEGMGLDYKVAETKENPRRGRKRKEGDQSGDANWSIETSMGNQASKEGRPSKRGRHTVNGDNRSGERQKPRRGRPRKIINQSAFTLIRKRFPSFPVIPSSVTSSKEVPSEFEEMEVSSFPAPAEGTAREAPEKVHSDWQSIKAEAHRLLGCSSYTSKYRTIQLHMQEEHSSTNALSNEETVSEIQSTKKRSKKSPLEQENPCQTMVIEQGGNAGKQIFDPFSKSQMKGNCSGTAVPNTKQTTVSSSFSKGDVKGKSSGNSKDRKAETAKRIGGGTGRKQRTNFLCSLEAGSSRSACANGSRRLKCKGKAGDEEHYSSVKKKAKTRTLTGIYDDIRSLIRFCSKLNETEEISNGK